MTHRKASPTGSRSAFTLIELLTVVAIISLLISILMPSLSRARDQAKGVVCLSRLKDMGNAIVAYTNTSNDHLPPAEWRPDEANQPDLRYGWCELVYEFVYKEKVYRPELEPQPGFPVQRNVDSDRYFPYFKCKASPVGGKGSGDYRVYLPGWAAGTYSLHPDGMFDTGSGPDPTASVSLSAASPRMVLIGDANAYSERGDGDPSTTVADDCSYIDAGEANISGIDGKTGNRFSDRHYGGTNFLYQDMHGEWLTNLRKKLARDFDLNGIEDIEVAPGD